MGYRTNLIYDMMGIRTTKKAVLMEAGGQNITAHSWRKGPPKEIGKLPLLTAGYLLN